jgi:hypothetical protein
VLAELLLAATDVDEELFAAFRDRRHERVRTVVEGSCQMAQWLLDRVEGADVPGLMGRVMGLVTEPA